jgi:hypothetical protein
MSWVYDTDLEGSLKKDPDPHSGFGTLLVRSHGLGKNKI